MRMLETGYMDINPSGSELLRQPGGENNHDSCLESELWSAYIYTSQQTAAMSVILCI